MNNNPSSSPKTLSWSASRRTRVWLEVDAEIFFMYQSACQLRNIRMKNAPLHSTCSIVILMREQEWGDGFFIMIPLILTCIHLYVFCFTNHSDELRMQRSIEWSNTEHGRRRVKHLEHIQLFRVHRHHSSVGRSVVLGKKERMNPNNWFAIKIRDHPY